MAESLDIIWQIQNAINISEFQRKVYLEVLKIPLGETITYGQLAMRIGCKSAQAVGGALRRNPFAPIVPCHRVVAANGSIGGYFGYTDGEMVEKKRLLLEQEFMTAQTIKSHTLSK